MLPYSSTPSWLVEGTAWCKAISSWVVFLGAFGTLKPSLMEVKTPPRKQKRERPDCKMRTLLLGLMCFLFVRVLRHTVVNEITILSLIGFISFLFFNVVVFLLREISVLHTMRPQKLFLKKEKDLSGKIRQNSQQFFVHLWWNYKN